jgi:hypothetical protein
MHDLVLSHHRLQAGKNRRERAVEQLATKYAKCIGFSMFFNSCGTAQMSDTISNIDTHTFGYREETDDNKSIVVSSPHIVVHIANRGIQGVIFIVTRAHGDSSLVTTKDDRDEC